MQLTEISETKYSPKNVTIASTNFLRSHAIGRLIDRPAAAATPLPPSLCPPLPNAGPAAVPASFTPLSTAAVSAGGLAPCTVLTTEPLCRTRKVGMARTEYICATACWLSTSTLQKVIFLGLEYLVERDSKVGAIVLQGPHQSA